MSTHIVFYYGNKIPVVSYIFNILKYTSSDVDVDFLFINPRIDTRKAGKYSLHASDFIFQDMKTISPEMGEDRMRLAICSLLESKIE